MNKFLPKLVYGLWFMVHGKNTSTGSTPSTGSITQFGPELTAEGLTTSTLRTSPLTTSALSAGKKGFTLVELLVVITILAILAVVGITTFSGVQSRGRDTRRLDDARKLVTALEQYKSGAGVYPLALTTVWTTNSTITSPWISGLDTSNFIKNELPADPKNTGRLIYFYESDATGSDYCLQIPQENNASGHAYYKGRWATGGGSAVASDPWQLRFGPSGPKNGLCEALENVSP